MQDYFIINVFMPEIISLKNIFVIKQEQICPDPPKYGSKSMQYFKAYKYVVEYTLNVQLFTCCTQQEQYMYTRHFLIETFAEQ